MLVFLFNFLLFFFGTNTLFDFQKILCNNKYFEPLLWTVHGDINNFNIALPDSYANYEGSFICLDKNDTIYVNGVVPKSRYFSFQIYDSTTESLGSINDHQITLFNKTNFMITITKSNMCDNFQNIIRVTTNDTFLLFVFRTYDLEPNHKLILPNITKNNKLLPHAKTYTKINFPKLYRNTKPVREHKFANEDNNFFKPVVKTFFHNSDADYLISLIKVNQSNPVGAIIYGILPMTKLDMIQNYDVRYVSFNMGITSSALPTIAGDMLVTTDANNLNISSTGTPGISDKHIIEKYQNHLNWNKNRSYVIYIGATIEQIKSLGANINTDLYLLYPKMSNGKYFTYVSILHRHLMPQKKTMLKPIFNKSISDITGHPVYPKECEKIMGEFYPKIKFYL